MGAPSFVPTAEQRRMVHAMAGCGVPQDDIVLVIGITSRTLRKHFRHELDVAVIEANTRVAQCLYKQATTPGNIGASIFWLKGVGRVAREAGGAQGRRDGRLARAACHHPPHHRSQADYRGRTLETPCPGGPHP
ncbi:MAG: hypothetical protein JWR10_893 [Rubritepida sp.]|nr:hypothetical protein [Rubritepida sp.]